jgi:hypothetical protein
MVNGRLVLLVAMVGWVATASAPSHAVQKEPKTAGKTTTAMTEKTRQWLTRLGDAGQPEEERLSALGRLQRRITPDLITALLKVLDERGEGNIKLKTAAIQLLRVAALTEYALQKQGAIDRVVRQYYAHPNPTLRHHAIAYGTLKDDPRAFEVVEQDLEKPTDQRLFSDEAALGYLTERGKSEVFNKYIDASDERVRSLAVQMALPERSRKRLLEILNDKREPVTVRRAAAKSLSEDINAAANVDLWNLVNDTEEPAELRLVVAEYLKQHLSQTQTKIKEEQSK